MAYKIKLLVLGPVGTNCYIYYNETDKDAIIIDPADKPEVIRDFIEKEQLNLKAVLLTHGHFDHIGAVKDLCEKYNVKIYGHEAEEEVLVNPEINLSVGLGRTQLSFRLDEKLRDNQTLDIIGLSIRVLHTPGHTVGGVCYYIPSEGICESECGI